MALMPKKALQTYSAFVDVSRDPFRHQRWTAVSVTAKSIGEVTLATIYLQHTVGPSHHTNAQALATQGRFLRTHRQAAGFVVIGGWSCTPQDLHDVDFPAQTEGYILTPQGVESTSSGSGRVIDFAAASWSLRGLLPRKEHDTWNFLSAAAAQERPPTQKSEYDLSTPAAFTDDSLSDDYASQ